MIRGAEADSPGIWQHVPHAVRVIASHPNGPNFGRAPCAGRLRRVWGTACYNRSGLYEFSNWNLVMASQADGVALMGASTAAARRLPGGSSRSEASSGEVDLRCVLAGRRVRLTTIRMGVVGNAGPRFLARIQIGSGVKVCYIRGACLESRRGGSPVPDGMEECLGGQVSKSCVRPFGSRLPSRTPISAGARG
jgi:hypothetical protein